MILVFILFSFYSW